MSRSPLADYAESAGLTYTEKASLPAAGQTLTAPGGKVEGAATGLLKGGVEGTLAHFSYVHESTDSDGHTTTEQRHFTLAVVAVPESIGFLPHFGFAWPGSNFNPMAGGTEMAPVHLPKDRGFEGAVAQVYRGTNEHWLTQLLSPALVEWLSRSGQGFGFELAGGTLICGRGRHLTAARELDEVCADAARLAIAIREESLEEAATTGGAVEAARSVPLDPLFEHALAEVEAPEPKNVIAAEPAFRRHLAASPTSYLRTLKTAVIGALLLNVPAVAIPILLISSENYLWLALFEGLLVGTIGWFVFRSRLKSGARICAVEAFYRGYARARGLTLVDPLRFAAAHAEARIGFKPDRVLAGPLPGGGEGAMALAGDGSKRTDRVAVTLGPRGPVAEEELDADAPGIGTADLDRYLAALTAEAREDAATAPDPARPG